MAWLDDHPPDRAQFRCPRRQTPSGVIVVHTAENVPDHVGYDGGAEAVARFIRHRPGPGSYHDLVDSDSTLNLVRHTCEAFHDATGTNPHSFGLSIATRADIWPLAPQRWRDGALDQAAGAAAAYARWVRERYNITIPATRLTADEARRKTPGFVSHAQLDPTRRSDPGRDFPWSEFLARYRVLTGTRPTPPPPPEDDDMRYLVTATAGPLKGRWYITDGILKRYVDDKVEAQVLVNSKLCNAAGTDDQGKPVPHGWPGDTVEDLKDVADL